MVDENGNWWENVWKIVGAVVGAVVGGVVGFAAGGVPGAIIGGLAGGAIGVEFATEVETEAYVANSTAVARDFGDVKETYSMNREDAMSYIRFIREKDSVIRENWTEGEMLREWEYHKRSFPFLRIFGEEEGTLGGSAKTVDFEDKQTAKTYLYRFLGNLLIG